MVTDSTPLAVPSTSMRSVNGRTTASVGVTGPGRPKPPPPGPRAWPPGGRERWGLGRPVLAAGRAGRTRLLSRLVRAAALLGREQAHAARHQHQDQGRQEGGQGRSGAVARGSSVFGERTTRSSRLFLLRAGYMPTQSRAEALFSR